MVAGELQTIENLQASSINNQADARKAVATVQVFVNSKMSMSP